MNIQGGKVDVFNIKKYDKDYCVYSEELI